MVTVQEPLSDFKDIGPVIYQESKLEWYIKLFLGVHFADKLP